MADSTDLQHYQFFISMSDCTKNNTYSLLNGGGLQIRSIKFNNDRTVIQLVSISNGAIECTRDIDDDVYLGISIVNNDLVFSDAISGLSTDLTMEVTDNPLITIQPVSGVLNIIGVDDVVGGFTTRQVNVRYDSGTNTVQFQI